MRSRGEPMSTIQSQNNNLILLGDLDQNASDVDIKNSFRIKMFLWVYPKNLVSKVLVNNARKS